LDHDRIGAPALVVRLTRTCDTTGATAQRSDEPSAQGFVRAVTQPPGNSVYQVVAVADPLVTARLGAVRPADAAVVSDAASIVGFATRQALQQALDQRSNGRLQLDPGRRA